jgi:hypothetical protein
MVLQHDGLRAQQGGVRARLAPPFSRLRGGKRG